MKYKASIFDLLQSFVSAMTFPVTIYKVTNVGNTYTLNVDDVYHAVIGATLTIGGNKYVIVSWNENYAPHDGVMQLVVTGNVAITATSFNFYAPFFAHGTIREQGAQLMQNNNVWNKYPLIWAKEGVEEIFYNDRDEAHERQSSLCIYFLVDNNPNIPNEDIYELYTRPMTRLKDNFIKVLNTETGNFPLGHTDREGMTFKVNEITKVGINVKSNETTKSLFGDDLSGIALEFKLKLMWPQNEEFAG